MGSAFTKLFSNFAGGKPSNILMVGLDNAGKTSILYKLKLGNLVTTIPTIGYNLETITYKNLKFIIRDVGGQDKIRSLWKDYCGKTVNAVIFVVDSTDSERFEEAGEEFQKLVDNSDLSNAAFLVLANKQDRDEAVEVAKIAEVMKLQSYNSIKWSIFSCSAEKGDSLFEGMEWLSSVLKDRKK